MRWTTLSGRELSFNEPTGDLAAYWDRLQRDAADPTVSHDALLALLYHADNPLLDRTLMPGRGSVTRAVIDNPLYQAMTDLLGRKQVQLGQLDLETAGAPYTVTLAEAAEELGLSSTAARQAIDSYRLAGWKKGGVWFIHPASVEAYKHANYGPAIKPRTGERLEVRMGTVGSGETLKLKYPAGEMEKEAGHVHTGHLTAGWRRVGVLTTSGPTTRFFALEPAEEMGAIELGGFYVRGRFRRAATENSSAKARLAWKAFTPA
jgi:hypothetical protein